MKTKLKTYLCTILSAVICICSFCITTYAADNTNTIINIEPEEIIELAMPRGSMPLSEGGVLSNETKLFTFTIPSSTTYTFTISVKPSDSNGIWTILQKAGGSAIIDKNISGSFQQRYYLTSGTWYLQLTSAPGTSSYAVSIHETY